ncbi:acetate--CoA ligase family protein [Acuticoccus sp. I52.16.1]|uniref:acetate--CoA ligase family protein n=1 Tax=Acuticoccus sp. I52.16.1 TaxID=2928472 RepID=UPI001FD626B7|nr:acetate--CoA ligase family protein [Acuticoccus sp. I52.16.1]UOM35281.1 acetate--CoA ligase family protein [Acuticoccus sp. I52.16.1]
MSLAALVRPSSVAVVGASDNTDKIGGRPLYYMKALGYRGRILPINPARQTVQGIPAFASLEALPEAPDCVVVAVPGQAAIDAVEAAARIGAKAAIIIASGFGELGAAGKAEEARMRTLANAAGMRLVGPNSQGLANFGTGAIMSFSTMFIEEPPQDGPVAIVSQSGAMAAAPYGLLRQRGIGVRHVNATGNDCDVTASELATEIVQDEGVRLLLLYLEALDDPAMLARAAALGRERGVPIIAIKSGRSAQGARAAASHTGAIATPDRTVDAFFAKHGIWRADGMADLVRATEMYLQGWRPQGRNVAILSNSGASGVLCADAAERAGLPLATLAPETEATVAAALPTFASPKNPIDVTAALLSDPGLIGKVLPAAGADPDVHMFLLAVPISGRGYDFPGYARDAAAFTAATGKPVVLAAPQRQVRDAFAAVGVPAFQTEDEAIAALSQFARHNEMLARPVAAMVPPRPAAGPAATSSEAASLDLLARFGVPTVARRLCASADEAVRFLGQIGGRIVLKAASAAIPHKSEHGLVHVGLGDPAAVEAAFARIAATVEALGHPFEGALAAEMVRGERELAIGGVMDPVFGPVVMIGDGGIAVEAMPDNALLLPPFTAADVDDALARLRIAPLFQGVRGHPPLDRRAVAAAAQAVAALLMDAAAGVVSVDINPLMVTATGAVAVDGLVETAAGAPAGTGGTETRG